ncbi:hypothetical protein COCON_G00191830 [Conger conger]|uniref:Uncharacterized protein n=2 Tax=Conger conger TaxID=82655 RepID=A0A9Q1D3A3_CONCO|nr:hypothetical protein COCON_G00191830 [Conger conger]
MTSVEVSNTVAESTSLSSRPTDQPDTTVQFSPTNLVMTSEMTTSSADSSVYSQSSSTAFLSTSSETSAHSEVNVTKQPESTVVNTEQTLKASSASSFSTITTGTFISSSNINKPSATTVVMTTISPTGSHMSSSKNTPTVTTKVTTRTSITPTHVTTKKTTVAATTSCEGSRVTHIRIDGLTSKEINVSWSGNNLRPEMKYTVRLRQGSNTSDIIHESTEKKTGFTDLLPGVTYTLIIEYFSCSNKEEFMRKITTVANIYESTTRIPSINFRAEYQNQSSQEFQELASHFKEEVIKNLPREYQDFIQRKEMRVIVTQIREGSVIIDFDLLTDVEIGLQTSAVEKNIINALNTSSLDVDLEQTTTSEADVCDRGNDLCSENGTCQKIGPSYTCECNGGFVDQNPNLPGTDCQRSFLTTISPTSHQTTSGKDNCEGVCSSLAECTVIDSGRYGCQCHDGLIDPNPSNPGKLCEDRFDCFSEETNLCSDSNTCLRSKYVCSRKNLFKAVAELKSWQFRPALYNTESQDWINVSTQFTVTVISKMRGVLEDESFDLSVVGFKRGSVVVRTVFGFNDGSHLDASTLETALQDVVRANLDRLALVTVEGIPAEENSGGRWRVTTIVLGVLLGAVLLAIAAAGLGFAVRRGLNRRNSYEVQQPKDSPNKVPAGTFGNYVCQEV